MDENTKLTQELMEITREKHGTVTKEQEAKIKEFSESFLLLLDDTEK